MPIVSMPDGTRVEFPDDMSREQIRAMILKKFPEADPEIGGTTKQIARGAAQGAVLDPIEGIGQIIEHATGKKIPIPQSVRNWFDKVRENTEATGTGTASRIGGAIASFLVAPEAALGARAASIGYRASRMKGPELVAYAQKLGRPEATSRISAYAGKLGKTPNRLTNDEVAEALLTRVPSAPATGAARFGRQAGLGAVAGAVQPVTDTGEEGSFATEKGLQALAGGVLGGAAGLPIGQLALKHLGRHRYHYSPWTAAAMLHNPAHGIPALGTLGALAAQYGLEKAGPRVAAPLGAAGGQAVDQIMEEQRDEQAQ